LVVFPIAFSNFLDVMVQHPGLALFSSWEDTAFNTFRGDVAWPDARFENGWTIAWLYGQSDSAEFEISNTTLILGATFNGYNNNYKGGISGIIVKKDADGLNTSSSPFLAIHTYFVADSPKKQ
jgi:hypothetical protein